jgi:hypothetical protein
MLFSSSCSIFPDRPLHVRWISQLPDGFAMAASAPDTASIASRHASIPAAADSSATATGFCLSRRSCQYSLDCR